MRPKQLFWYHAFILMLIHQTAPAQVVMTEIMFNPAGNERYDEFIELFNLSSTDTIDLHDWILSDGSGTNRIKSLGMGTRLPPHQHAILLVPGYSSNSTLYEGLIPIHTLRLTIDETQFGSYGLNNSRSEVISLTGKDAVTMSAWSYTVPNEEGISEEKIRYEAGDAMQNWTHSAAVHGTPGYRNSASPCPNDLALRRVDVCPQPEMNPDSLCLCATVVNQGSEPVSDFSLQTFLIPDCTAPHVRGPLLASFQYRQLLFAQDSVLCQWRFHRPAGIAFCLEIGVVFSGDEDSTNNRVFWQARPQLGNGPLLINEILYNTEEKSQEWIELYNPDSLAVDLRQWQVCDAQKKVVLTEQSCLVPAYGYWVVANSALADSVKNLLVNASLPELNNSGDQIRLLDAAGRCRDSLSYSAEWGGGRSVSLERKRWHAPSHARDNWATCRSAAGSTPGHYNSVSPFAVDVGVVAGSLIMEPTQRIENEPAVVSCQVENCGLVDLQDVRVDFYVITVDDSSLMDFQEIARLSAGERKAVLADWLHVPAGASTVCVKALAAGDAWLENNSLCLPVLSGYAKPELALNEIMILPASGEPEWIECYNAGKGVIDLTGWHFCDADASRMCIINPPKSLLAPGGFLIVCPDSAWPAVNLPAEALTAVISNWPSLSSDQDAIRIFDGSGQCVESISWDATWNIERGKSLERLSPLITAQERSNWGNCVEASGHTAGKLNSLYHSDLPPAATFDVAPNPFSPDGDGWEDTMAIHYVLPARTARINLRIFDTLGRQVRFLCNYEPSGSQRTLFWDGLDEEGRRCRIGPYILFLEAFDEESGRLLQMKKVCILAGQL